MISDVPIVIVWGHHESCQYKMANLILVMCVVIAPSTGRSTAFLRLLGPSCSLRHNNIEISPVNSPTKPSKWSSVSESPLTVDQKLELIPRVRMVCQGSDHGKPGPPAPDSSCECKGNTLKGR